MNPISLKHYQNFCSNNENNLRKEHEISRFEIISSNEIEHFLQECKFICDRFLNLGPNIFRCNVVEVNAAVYLFHIFIIYRFSNPNLRFTRSFSEMNLSVLTEIRRVRVEFRLSGFSNEKMRISENLDPTVNYQKNVESEVFLIIISSSEKKLFF